MGWCHHSVIYYYDIMMLLRLKLTQGHSQNPGRQLNTGDRALRNHITRTHTPCAEVLVNPTTPQGSANDLRAGQGCPHACPCPPFAAVLG